MAKELLKIQSKRKRESADFWIRVATDVNAGLTPDEIRMRYVNPKTNKNYTRQHIYWIIRQLKERVINI